MKVLRHGVVSRFLWLAIHCVLIAGCSRPSITGDAYLTFGTGEVRPLAGQEVFLFPGNRELLISEVFKHFDDWAIHHLSMRQQSAILKDQQSHENELALRMAALEALALEHDWLSVDVLPSCGEVVQDLFSRSSLAESENAQEHVEELSAKIASASDAIQKQQQQLRRDATALARRLKEQYIQESISLEVLGRDVWYDDYKFSVKITNKGPLAIRSVATTLQQDGKKLFSLEESDRYFYSLPSTDFSMDYRQNNYGELLFGLAPGEQYVSSSIEFTFNASRLLGDRLRELENRGFEKSRMNAVGPVLIDAELSNIVERLDKVGDRRLFPSQNAETVFRGQIDEALRPKREELARLERQSRAWHQELQPMQEIANVCEQFVALHSEVSELREMLAARDNGETAQISIKDRSTLLTAAGLNAELGVFLSKMQLGNPEDSQQLNERLEEIYATVQLDHVGIDMTNLGTVIEEAENTLRTGFSKALSTADRSRTNREGKFAFDNLKAGDYVVVLGYQTNLTEEVWWFEPKEVRGQTAIDLTNFNMEEGSMMTLLSLAVAERYLSLSETSD